MDVPKIFSSIFSCVSRNVEEEVEGPTKNQQEEEENPNRMKVEEKKENSTKDDNGEDNGEEEDLTKKSGVGEDAEIKEEERNQKKEDEQNKGEDIPNRTEEKTSTKEEKSDDKQEDEQQKKEEPPVDILRIASAATIRGNKLFNSCNGQTMTRGRMRGILNEAIAEYQKGLDILSSGMTMMESASQIHLDINILAESDLNQYIAIAYARLGRVDIGKVTKFNCFAKYAEHLSESCRLQEILYTRHSNMKECDDGMRKAVGQCFNIALHFFDKKSCNEVEHIRMLTAFVLKLDIRIKDRTKCRFYQKCLADVWLRLGKLQFNVAYAKIAQKSYREGLSLMSEVFRSVEEASLFTGDEEHDSEVRVLRGDYQSNLSIAQALQSLRVGEDMVQKALKEEENLPIELVWTALDKLKESELLTKGEDIEVLCMSLASRGIVYLRVLKLQDKAKLCLTEALEISKTLQGNLYTSTTWYLDLTKAVQEIRQRELAKEQEKWEGLRATHLEALKEVLKVLRSKEDAYLSDLSNFIFTKCSPVHLSDSARKNSPKIEGIIQGSPEEKKAFQKLITMFHPDKVDKEKHGMKHYVLMEEVTKVLTMRYNRIKGV